MSVQRATPVHPARPGRRAFTLVELMVAVTGGLFVSIAVFMLAKHSTGFYQAEARVGNATFGNLVGFNRLKTDISRAGYLTTPNVRTDPRVCGNPAVDTWPAALGELASVRITKTNAASLPAILTDDPNGRAPDEILLAGSYASADQFETGPIYMNGSDRTIQLRANSAALGRLGYLDASGDATAQQQLLESVFGAGRALRIVDKTGREQYGEIVSVQGGSTPQINIKTGSPPFQQRSSSTYQCGINDLGVGSLVNVVNLVRYRIEQAAGAGLGGYDPAVAQSTGPTTDAGRTELVRAELDVAGNVINDTVEVVAEFAVDLKFGITVANTFAGATNQTALKTHLPAAANVYTWANKPSTTAPGPGPERIRSVRARLSVRSRQADRKGPIKTADDGDDFKNVPPGFYRMQVGVDDNNFPLYARVRTIQADIALRNQLDEP